MWIVITLFIVIILGVLFWLRSRDRRKEAEVKPTAGEILKKAEERKKKEIEKKSPQEKADLLNEILKEDK